MFYSSSRFAEFVCLRGPLAFVVLIVGCGYAEYESRLNESRKYYAYLEKVETALTPKWSATGNLMDMRVPRQFSLIPEPQPTPLADGTFEKPTTDPRQPDYLNLTLPELFGAWQAPFTVSKPEGPEECKGYIYALCNYWQLEGKQASDASEFVANLKTRMAESLGIPVSDERTEEYPKGNPLYQYQQQQVYDVCSFKGKDINGTNYTFELYSRTNGTVIGVVVIVLPEGMEMTQKPSDRIPISERIPMMLASFNFTKNAPPPGSSPDAAGQPASTAPAAGTGF